MQTKQKLQGTHIHTKTNRNTHRHKDINTNKHGNVKIIKHNKICIKQIQY